MSQETNRSTLLQDRRSIVPPGKRMISPARTWTTATGHLVTSLGACLGLVSCGEVKLEPRAPAMPAEQQAGSRVAPNPLEPLVIEWPASERAELEAQLRSGPVAVSYDGRSMHVLTQCRVAGAYAFRPTNVHRDSVVIENEDALAAFLPLGVASLRGKLRQAGKLQVSMTVVGTWRTEPRSYRSDELEGDCREATHIVVSVAVGAFQIQTGGSASVGAGVMVRNIGAEGSHEARHDTVSKAGDESACARVPTDSAEPPERCGALVRLGLVHIHRAAASPPPQPAAPPEPVASASSAAPAVPPLATATASSSLPPPPRLFEPAQPSLLPASASPSTEPSRPAPSRTSPWLYVLGGTVLALLVGVGIAVAATKKDPERQPPPTGGLGNTTLSTEIRW